MKRSQFLHSLLVLPTALLLPGCNKSETGAGAAGAGKVHARAGAANGDDRMTKRLRRGNRISFARLWKLLF